MVHFELPSSQMRVSAFDFQKIIQIVVPFAAAFLALSAASYRSAQAQGNHMLVIPASDGYAFDDCLATDKSCGKIIADAWCEAHGMSASLSFSRAEDITATIPVAGKTEPLPKIAPGTVVVNCRE